MNSFPGLTASNVIWIPKQAVFGVYAQFVCPAHNCHALGTSTHGQYICACDMQVAKAFLCSAIIPTRNIRARITGPVIVAARVYRLDPAPKKEYIMDSRSDSPCRLHKNTYQGYWGKNKPTRSLHKWIRCFAVAPKGRCLKV